MSEGIHENRRMNRLLTSNDDFLIQVANQSLEDWIQFNPDHSSPERLLWFGILNGACCSVTEHDPRPPQEMIPGTESSIQILEEIWKELPLEVIVPLFALELTCQRGWKALDFPFLKNDEDSQRLLFEEAWKIGISAYEKKSPIIHWILDKKTDWRKGDLFWAQLMAWRIQNHQIQSLEEDFSLMQERLEEPE